MTNLLRTFCKKVYVYIRRQRKKGIPQMTIPNIPLMFIMRASKILHQLSTPQQTRVAPIQIFEADDETRYTPIVGSSRSWPKKKIKKKRNLTRNNSQQKKCQDWRERNCNKGSATLLTIGWIASSTEKGKRKETMY